MPFAQLPLAILLGLTAAALALPPALRDRSVKRFFASLAVVVLGVILPLAVFLLSALFVPEWKGGCPHGWLDAFHLGKLALTPLVLWAAAALYASDALGAGRPVRPWVRLGLLAGAVVASICLLFGIVTFGSEPTLSLFLLVPLYVAAWYALRAAQRLRAGGDRREAGWALLGSVPFWIGSLVWSHSIWRALPESPPECFVVTAASRGHRWLVGPRFEVQHRGASRLANRQLATLWQAEALWRVLAPASHARFRRVYDRVGPILARRITTPWRADAAWVALLPFELVARLWLALPSSAAGRAAQHRR